MKLVKKVVVVRGELIPTKYWCDCGEFLPWNVDNQVCCKRCRKIMHSEFVVNDGELENAKHTHELERVCEELKITLNNAEESLRRSQNSYLESTKRIDNLETSKREIEIKYDTVLKQKEETISKLLSGSVELSEKCSNFQKDIDRLMKDLESSRAELESLKAELDTVRRSDEVKMKAMSDMNAALNKDLTESRSSETYLKSLNEKLSSIKVRDMTQMFLDYMTAVNNAASDTNDLEKLKQTIAGRTEYVLMTSASHGVGIYRHEPGSDLAGDRVLEINEKATDDPSLDGKVCKSFRFGCAFEGGLYPEIPEKITVWVCDKKVSETDGSPSVDEAEPSVTDEMDKAEESSVTEQSAEVMAKDEEVTQESAEPIESADVASVEGNVSETQESSE